MPKSKLALPRKSLAMLGTLALMVVFLAILSVGGASAAGPTYIENDIAADTTWHVEDSPYVLNDTIYVQSGVTLTIEPGVQVNVTGSLIVEGTLVAEGTDEMPIVFTYNSLFMDSWDGLFFYDTSVDSVLDHVMIDNATFGVNIDNCVVPVTNCDFVDCEFGVFAAFDSIDGAVTVNDNYFRHCLSSVYVTISASSTDDEENVFSVPVEITGNFMEESQGIEVYRFATSDVNSVVELSGDVTIANNELAVVVPMLNAITFSQNMETYDDSMATISGDLTIMENSIYPYNATLGQGFYYGIYVYRDAYADSFSTASMNCAVSITDNDILANPSGVPIYIYTGAGAEVSGAVNIEGGVEVSDNEISEAWGAPAVIVDLGVEAYNNATVDVASAVSILNNLITNCSAVAVVDYDDILTADYAVASLDIGVTATGNNADNCYGGIAVSMDELTPMFESSMLISLPITISGNTMSVVDETAIMVSEMFATASSNGSVNVTGDILISENVIDITGEGDGIVAAVMAVAAPDFENVTCYANFVGDLIIENNKINMTYGQVGIGAGFEAIADNEMANSTAVVTIGDVHVHGNTIFANNSVETVAIVVIPYASAVNVANGSASVTIGSVLVDENEVMMLSVEPTSDKSLGGIGVGSPSLYSVALDGSASLVAGSFVVENNKVAIVVNNTSNTNMLGGAGVGFQDIYAQSLGGIAQTNVGDISLLNNEVSIITNNSEYSMLVGFGFAAPDLRADAMNGEADLLVGEMKAAGNDLSVEAMNCGMFNALGMVAMVNGAATANNATAELEAGAFIVSENTADFSIINAYDVSVYGVSVNLDPFAVAMNEGLAEATFGDISVDDNAVTVDVEYFDDLYVMGVSDFVYNVYASAMDANASVSAGSFTMLNNEVTVEAVDGNYMAVDGALFDVSGAYASNVGVNGSAVATYGSIQVNENVINITAEGVEYLYDDEYYENEVYGLQVYVEGMFASANGGVAEVTFGDISVCDNEVVTSYNYVYMAGENGIYVELDAMYAQANNANATATYGDIAVDGNTVSVEAVEVGYLYVYGIYEYVDNMFSSATFGNATLVVGNFYLNDNEVSLYAENSYDIEMNSIRYETVSETYGAASYGNGTASTTIGCLLVENNDISAVALTTMGGEYDGYGHFYFGGIFVEVNTFEDSNYNRAYASAAEYATNCVAVYSMGNVAVRNNAVAASASSVDDDYYAFEDTAFSGIKVDIDGLGAYTMGGVASNTMGNFNVSGNTVDLSASYVESSVFSGIEMYIYDAYAIAYDGTATVVAQDIMMCGNDVSTSVEDAYYFDADALYLDLENAYANSYGDAAASVTFGDTLVNANTVAMDATDVDNYEYDDNGFDGIQVYWYYIWAYADGGLADMAFGDLSVSENVIDVTLSEVYDTQVFGIYVYVYDTYAYSDYMDASAEFGNFVMDDNEVNVVADHVYYLDVSGLEEYIDYMYAYADNANATMTAGNFRLCGNKVSVDVEFGYDIEMDGITFETDYTYADVDGAGSASAVFGSICVQNNDILADVDYMDYYADFWDYDFSSFELDAIYVDVYDAYAEADGYWGIAGAVAYHEVGDLAVSNNDISVSSYETYFLYLNGIEVYFDEMYADAENGNATSVIGSFDVSGNDLDYYADEGFVRLETGALLSLEDMYAVCDEGNATVTIGDAAVSNNVYALETENNWGTSGYFDEYGPAFGLWVEDLYADAEAYAATLTVGDLAVCNNALTSNGLAVYDGVWVSLEDIYAEADEQGTASAVFGYVNITGNNVAISEWTYDVYGVYVYVSEMYANAYEATASVEFCAINVEENSVDFANAYGCYGINYEGDLFYALAYYGESAEFAVVNGINFMDNSVSMVAGMYFGDDEDVLAIEEVEPDNYGIYIGGIYGYANAYFMDSVATLGLAVTVSENTVSIEAQDDVEFDAGLNGIYVAYGVSLYYDEAFANVAGGLSVEANTVSLPIDYYGTGIYVSEYDYENFFSNNGVGVLDVPVSVQDNTVSGGSTGIQIMFAVNAVVAGNVVSDASDEGISLSFTEDVVFTDNTISGCGVALYAYYADDLTVSETVLSGNDDGMVIWYGYNVTITSNVISNNGDEMGGDGVEIYYTDNLLFADNEISFNAYDGVYIYGAANATLTNNVVTYNGFGAYISDSVQVVVEDNVFSYNEEDGLYVYDCGDEDEGVVLGNNTFEANWNNGLVVEDSDYVVIYNSVFADNGNFGLSVYGGFRNTWIVDAAAEVNNNDAQFEGQIYVYDGATLTLDYVSDFLIGSYDDEDEMGIAKKGPEDLSRIEVMEGGCLIATSTNFYNTYEEAWFFVVNGNLRMIDCSVAFCMGLYLGPTSEASIDTSVFHDAVGNGITIDGCAPRISGCVIEFADKDGIVVMGAEAKPVIKDCLIYANERGIYAKDTTLQYVVDNIILDNEVAGIYAEGVTGKIHDNVLFLNYREIFVVDSDVTIEGNQIGYANSFVVNGPFGSYIMEAVMDDVDIDQDMGLYQFSADTMNGNIGLYAIDSTVAAKDNTYGWLRYGVYAIGSDLTFSDRIQANAFQLEWYTANGTKITMDLSLCVYDGIFATDSQVTVSGAYIECLDDGLFLEASDAQVSGTTFLAGDYDVYLMEGSTCAINTSTLDKYKVEDDSVMYTEYCLTVTVKDQDGAAISGAVVVVTDANGRVWFNGTTDIKGVCKVYIPAFGELADGGQDNTLNPYTVSATKDNATKSITVTMGEADQSVSITLQVKKNSIFGMEPWVVGVIALVVVVALLAVLLLARRKK